MSLPAIHALRRAFPEARMTLLMDERWIPLIKRDRGFHEFLPWNPEEERGWGSWIRWAMRLKQKGFDCAVIMNPNRFFHWATFLAGIPTRVGYRRKCGFLLSHGITDTKALRGLHETIYNFELVQQLGAKGETSPLTLPLSPEGETRARELLADSGVSPTCRPIALHPWTSNPAKSWPLDSFRTLAVQLKSLGETVMAIGEPGGNLVDSQGFFAGCGVVDLIGKIPLEILPETLHLCAALVSNDSGPVHVAAAVGTPTLIVAPAQHAQQLSRWRPLGERHATLLSPMPEEVVQTLRGRFPCGS